MSDFSDGPSAFSPSPAPTTPAGSDLASTPPPPFPPPAATPTGASSRIAWIAAGVAAVVALLFAVLWFSSNGALGDAESERDEARSLLSATVDDQRANADALIETQADLTEAQAEIARLRAELDGFGNDEGDTDDEPAGDASAELQAEVDALNEQLAAREAELQTRIDELEAQVAAQPEAAAFDPTTTPDFARWFGELMSSRTGSSQLSQEQSTCFGTTIIADIGLDAVGRGLYLAATGADNNTVVGAMQRAADACGIPQGLIF